MNPAPPSTAGRSSANANSHGIGAEAAPATAARPAVDAPSTGSRPYSRMKGSEPSVTTILGAMKAVPALTWGAAKETALFAVHHQDEWTDLTPEDAVDLLRRHHRGVWDSKAANGTALHSVNEAWCEGRTPDLAEIVAHMADTDRNAVSWRGREAEVVKVLGGYVDGLEAFWMAYQPRTVLTEYVVRSPGHYIGTADWCAEIGGRRLLLDIKTTAQHDEEKGVYVDSWAPQLAAYRFAPEIVHFGKDEKGRNVITGTEPNLITDGAAVVHLRGEGHFDLFEIPADEAAHEAFMHMVAAHGWLKSLPKVPNRIERTAR